ncbi:MAG: septum formation initiator family protein [Nocardioides sp.]|nr:septum formation initiator family protein [Nocardioides sp.]
MADNRRTPKRATGPRARTGPGRGPVQRPRTSGATSAEPAGAAVERRRPRLTGRAAVLVLVLAVLMVSYASSLRAYLEQRAHLEDLSAKISERQASIDNLEQEKERWNDPAYVEQQARLRFGYVAPGETSYVVLDENGERLQSESALRDPETVIKQTPTAWWSTAWDSVELAGNPPKVGKPPAAEIDGSTEPQE